MVLVGDGTENGTTSRDAMDAPEVMKKEDLGSAGCLFSWGVKNPLGLEEATTDEDRDQRKSTVINKDWFVLCF